MQTDSGKASAQRIAENIAEIQRATSTTTSNTAPQQEKKNDALIATLQVQENELKDLLADEQTILNKLASINARIDQLSQEKKSLSTQPTELKIQRDAYARDLDRVKAKIANKKAHIQKLLYLSTSHPR